MKKAAKKSPKSKPKKRLTTLEKNKIEWAKRDAHIDVILLAYDKPIKYDYPLPEPYRIRQAVSKVIEDMDAPKAFKKMVSEVVWACKDEYSRLEDHMRLSDYTFGHEWFYGYGTLYRWREGAREKAEANIKKYVSASDMKYYKKLQDAIRIEEDIEEFETNKVMRI